MSKNQYLLSLLVIIPQINFASAQPIVVSLRCVSFDSHRHSFRYAIRVVCVRLFMEIIFPNLPFRFKPDLLGLRGVLAARTVYRLVWKSAASDRTVSCF
jgi:hypothetical protein